MALVLSLTKSFCQTFYFFCGVGNPVTECFFSLKKAFVFVSAGFCARGIKSTSFVSLIISRRFLELSKAAVYWTVFPIIVRQFEAVEGKAISGFYIFSVHGIGDGGWTS